MRRVPGLTRGKRGAFEYRQRVPLDLVDVFKRCSFSRYIGFVSAQKAQQTALQFRAEFDKLISEARALDPNTRAEASRIGFEKRRAAQTGLDRLTFAHAAVGGSLFDPEAPRDVQALQLLDAHELEAEAKAARARARTPAPSASFDALIDRWQRRTNPRSPGTVNQARLWVERFRTITGRKDVRAVTLQDAVAFRDAIEAAADNGEFTRDTARHGLLRVRRLFDVAAGDGLITSNPFAAVRVAVPDDMSNDARGFTDQQMRAMLGNLDQIARADHRMLFQLMAFTGRRAGDLTNLHQADVREVSGVLCLDIHAGNPGGTLKTKSAAGFVPVPTVIASDVRAYSAKCSGALFPHKRGARGAAERFQQLVSPFTKQHGGDTPHALRHTVINRLRAAGVAEHVIAAIAGHSGGRSVTAHYGKGADVAAMLVALDLVRY